MAERRRWWEPILRRYRAGGLGLVALVVLTAAAVFAPFIVGDPNVQDIAHRLVPPFESMLHPLGTDQLGRDMLARLLYGSRVSLLVGFVTVALAGAAGVLVGLWSGYYGGAVDWVTRWLTDVQLAFPFLLLMIAIVAVVGPRLQTLIITLSATNWMIFARVVRGQTLVVKGRDFAQAARAIGVPDLRIMVRHIFPNTIAPLTIIATFEVARMIITETSLSFLGLGVQPAIPSWGNMMADARAYITIAWWLVTFPGAAIAAVVLAINMVGDGLRDFVDPRLRT